MASGDHLVKNFVFVLFLVSLAENSYGNDILGCGGFVKSHVALDFSKIEIGLYTKAGSLKERTECAPTNGYYFLPLYEKGEYILKVHPPPGWSFEPSQVEIEVDGSSDQCSTGQDINFAFNGFGITGRVITAGQTQGPSGIAVQLVNDKGEKRDTLTSIGGDFHFTPVIPGKYTLKASHPRWKLEPAQAVVQVKEGNTALPAGVLAVKGYDVKGSVISYGSPIGGIYVLLYSKEENPKFRVEGCKTALLQGVPGSPICHSITDASGEFSFGLVPAGEYYFLALTKSPGQTSVIYNIKPEKVPFTVQHDSLYIKNAFEVTGFTVIGSVVAGPSGSGIAGARVLKDGTPVGNTDASGKFTLPSLQPGTYSLSFQHEQCQFDEVSLVVSGSGPRVPLVAQAARWRVCGELAPAGGRDVLLAGAGAVHRAAAGSDGKWCIFLQPGVYTAKVDVTEAEQREGLQFYPLSVSLPVPVPGAPRVSFSQLKARVAGRVRCALAADCAALPVTLRPLAPDGGYHGQPRATHAHDGEYEFTEVLPGSVEVSVPTSRLCWAEARHNVPVTAQQASVPAFQHTGYVLRLHSSHDIQVEYVSGSTRGSLAVPAGASQHCVAHAGRYELTPRGPHLFQPPSAIADTSRENPQTVSFVAVAHAVLIRVTSPDPVKDLVLKISSDGGTKEVGPLVPLEQPSGTYNFEHTLYMADGEVAAVSAQSSSLVVSPGAAQRVAAGAGPLLFSAARGLTLAGRLVPPVAHALVTLTSDELKLTQTTTADGTYSFGPLDASKQYKVTAEKDSYVFGERDERGDIAAHKLAEITVELVDEADDKPLQGALVSVSGGSYRRNAASGDDGRLRFGALAPDQYYVKPHMKEYRFSPHHHILTVQDGKHHHLKIKGSRVAWSCVGVLVSLGGAAWPGAVLRAAPPPARAPHCPPQDATTLHDGSFRIRGLLPNCVYTLQLKESSAPETLGLKLAKAPPAIEVKDNKDIENVRLIAILPQQITDANVLVYTPNIDHYKTLRLTLALEDTPHTPIYSTKLDPIGYSQHLNPGLMYVLPRLPADNKTYVLQLESTLSKSTHAYGEVVQYFNSDGKFKYFNIDFLPKVKSSEQELRQTSLLVVPLLGILVIAYWQRATLVAHVTSVGGAWVAGATGGGGGGARGGRNARHDLLDKASIDHILSTVNAAGKRTTKKKAQ